jgi:hypothetical protein
MTSTRILIACLLAAAAADIASAKKSSFDWDGIQIGFQGGLPGGLSAKKDLNDQVSAQVILDFFGGWGSVTGIGGRVNYDFQQNGSMDVFAYGGAALYTIDFGIHKESVIGFSGGAGVEWDLQEGIDIPIPLHLSIDAGIAGINFPNYGTALGGFFIGLGLHYEL